MAVDECIAEGVLKDYLTAHKAEVVEMCITEYNEQETMYAIREEGRIEQYIETSKEYGADDGTIISGLMKKFKLTEQEAALRVTS